MSEELKTLPAVRDESSCDNALPVEIAAEPDAAAGETGKYAALALRVEAERQARAEEEWAQVRSLGIRPQVLLDLGQQWLAAQDNHPWFENLKHGGYRLARRKFHSLGSPYADLNYVFKVLKDAGLKDLEHVDVGSFLRGGARAWQELFNEHEKVRRAKSSTAELLNFLYRNCSLDFPGKATRNTVETYHWLAELVRESEGGLMLDYELARLYENAVHNFRECRGKNYVPE